MTGKNWNSRTGAYTDLVNYCTINKARRAQKLKTQEIPVKEIAQLLNVSISRVYEYLRLDENY